MKGFIVGAALMLVCLAAFAESSDDRGASVTMANFSGSNAGAANQHGWTFLGENDSDAFWFSYWTDKSSREVAVVMKDGVKGVGDGYIQARFISGFIDCRGSDSKNLPSMLHVAHEEVWSFVKGQTVYPLSSTSGLAPSVPVVHGTVMAEIIKRVCPLTANIWKDEVTGSDL